MILASSSGEQTVVIRGLVHFTPDIAQFAQSTARQKEEAAEVAASEPQEVYPGLFLGSRACVTHKRARVVEMGIRHVIQCCDRAPDDPRTFETRVVFCNNESRDSSDQHARHAHGPDDPCCGGGGEKSSKDHQCTDLHLLKWTDGSTLADSICAWVRDVGGPVLVVGFDGRTNSAAVVCAILMRNHGMALRTAWESIVAVRPIVWLTPALRRDLQAYEVRIASEASAIRFVPPRK